MNTLAIVNEEVRTEGVDYFDPQDYLVDVVRRATANRQDLHISAQGLGELVVLSSRGEYFSSIEKMATFCKLNPERMQVEVLKPQDPRRPDEKAIGRNIDELMWEAGFHASSGRLIKGCYRDDVVELSHWPNLTRLPRTENTVRIAAFFTRYPTSITFASRLLKVERSELFQFYSAAHCAGVARAVNRQAEEPVLEPHRNQTMLSALLGRIVGL
jgi:hypothetical protein